MKSIGTATPVSRETLLPQTGTAFTVCKGQILRVIDVEGEQVADLVCFARNDVDEHLSAGHTVDYGGKLFFSAGDSLYSNLSRPMLAIVGDRVGRHPMLYAPCSQEMFRISYGATAPHPNCLDNLARGLQEYGVRPSRIPTPLNLFMNVTVGEEGALTIHPPRSAAGDYVELRAEMDLVVGVSACSAGACNNYHCTAIEVKVFGFQTTSPPAQAGTKEEKVRLEPMNETDFAACIDLSARVHAEDQVQVGNWTAESAHDKAKAGLARLLPDGRLSAGHHFYTVRDGRNGKVVGFLWFAVQGHKAFLWDIQIDEEHRCSGYATAALTAFEHLAREMGLDAITLHTFGHNRPARMLYQKLNFRETSVTMEKSLAT